MGFNAFNDLQFEEADTCILFQYADFSFCDPRYDHGCQAKTFNEIMLILLL